MIIVGLTGILGSGKSTVAAALRKRGLDVIDFDGLAKESLNWKETQEDIREAFGDEYVVMGRVDVERLRQTVFTNDLNVRKLEAIIHPRVHEEVERRLVALEEKDVLAAIIEHPLLFEVGFHRPVDKIVVVTAKDDIIRARLEKRGMRGDDVERRLSFQIPLKEKEEKADYVINNNGAEDQLGEQIDSLVQEITKWEERGHASK
ncbi:MAG: dephospho-CoA kinase [Syntrophorhabdales bacterium]|jgi:dephospho-CoA kinase